MDTPLKILLVEDLDTDAELLIRYLKREKVEFSHLRVWWKDDFISGLRDFKPDLVIADHSMPGFSGMEAFYILKEKELNIPFILITGSISEKFLMQYMKDGIDDYILKDNLLRLPSAIENVINKKKLEVEKQKILKLNNELLHTNQKLGNANADISDSINYARKIQDAMLPSVETLQEIFPGSFILFKPKDVLSGDFYWFEKKNDKFYIAVADCTGHGVPGALLAMMGFNLLNDIIKLKDVDQPSDILNRLNDRVRKVLKHDRTFLHDGMDIALCSIDIKTNILEFSGAWRPLYIVRKGELIEIKGDKITIGSLDHKTQYANHEVELKKNDKIFIFTDGFADQFNNEDKKRMTIKRLQLLLTKSHALAIKNQEDILTAFFDEWKGDKDQIDDVLLVGIEISR